MAPNDPVYDENDFVESNHTATEVADFYNACGYTPEDVPTDPELHNGNWVPMTDAGRVYWSNEITSWLPVKPS